MGTIESLTSLAMIFIMIIPGIILSRKNIISKDQTEGINTLVANVTWPCLVINGMQIPFSKEILWDSGFIFVALVAVFIFAFFMGKVLTKLISMEKERTYLFIFMLIFANTGFMGIPVTQAILGEEAVFYASILEMVQDIFLFTLGIMLIQFSTGAAMRADVKQFLSPGLVGVLIGFFLFLFDIQLPGFLGKSVEIVGDSTTPLTMIIIGLQLGRMKWSELIGDRSIYWLSFFKLLIVPALTCLILFYWMGETSLMAKVIIMEMAMPVAACTTIFTMLYKGDVEFATKGVLLSTLFSILTLPIFTVWISMF